MVAVGAGCVAYAGDDAQRNTPCDSAPQHRELLLSLLCMSITPTPPAAGSFLNLKLSRAKLLAAGTFAADSSQLLKIGEKQHPKALTSTLTTICSKMGWRSSDSSNSH